MIKEFLLALQFLSIFPVKVKDVDDRHIALSCIFFPVIGALIGLVLFGLYWAILNLHLGPLLNSAVVIISLVIISGGLHLDGLSDTFDALASRKDKPSALDIMRDSQTGAAGSLSLISIIILKILLLSQVFYFNKLSALLFMCILSRWSQVVLIKIFKYARDEGKAKVFFSGMNNGIFLAAGFSSLLFSIFIFWPLGLWLYFGALVFTIVLGKIFSLKFGGLTGDTIGATSEIVEVFVLLLVITLQG